MKIIKNEYGHSYRPELEKNHNYLQALLIEYFLKEINKNKRKNIFYAEGDTWCAKKHAEICEHFFYLNKYSLKTAIVNLKWKKIIKMKFLSKNPLDRTYWYSIDEYYLK